MHDIHNLFNILINDLTKQKHELGRILRQAFGIELLYMWENASLFSCIVYNEMVIVSYNTRGIRKYQMPCIFLYFTNHNPYQKMFRLSSLSFYAYYRTLNVAARQTCHLNIVLPLTSFLLCLRTGQKYLLAFSYI